MEQAQTSYWRNITTAVNSLLIGLKLTFRHLKNARKSRKPVAIFDPTYFKQPDGIATIQYPHEILPVPVNGRYRLHNEIDDCIVCDKCAKICPVDCITIEPVRAVEEFGKTSDGTPKRIYAATFDINMAQCCFCGLCTTVCPTECLTMTKVYDFSVTDIKEHTYAFAEMTPAEIESKKIAFEEYQRSKTKVAPAVPESPVNPDPSKGVAPRPVFKPKMKPPGPTPPTAT
jgi:formate hydrogenlyase subunit 6/NADH:ubiquinone oxidoreductase subunit I